MTHMSVQCSMFIWHAIFSRKKSPGFSLSLFRSIEWNLFCVAYRYPSERWSLKISSVIEFLQHLCSFWLFVFSLPKIFMLKTHDFFDLVYRITMSNANVDAQSDGIWLIWLSDWTKYLKNRISLNRNVVLPVCRLSIHFLTNEPFHFENLINK